jgi:hypothetical protein
VAAVDRDERRNEVAARGLTPAAVTHLTRDALGTVDFAVLAPVKKLLKRYFSADPWTAADDDALADLVGVGSGWWSHDLDDDFGLEFGWRDGAFRIEVVARSAPGATFAGPVTPEATPNPRTIRFVTPSIHDGPSRWYESAAGADDPRVARLFAEFDDIANVLVGPTFVAIGLHRPDRWEALLDDVLRAVTVGFAATTTDREQIDAPGAESGTEASHAHRGPDNDRGTALEHAWKELGGLRADTPADLERIIAATASARSADRQVAARLLGDADPDTAEAAWSRLLDDESRRVRRATVDAMVDAARPSLRPRLEDALADTDAWTRWKALRGLVDLGITPSRPAVVALAEDPDFRVRLEVARALTPGDLS